MSARIDTDSYSTRHGQRPVSDATTITLGLAFILAAGAMSALVTYYTAQATIDRRVTQVEARIEAVVNRMEQSNESLAKSIDLLRDELRSYYQRKP